jgi:hypothetical protein
MFGQNNADMKTHFVSHIAKRRTLAFSCGARSASELDENDYLKKMLSRRQLQGFVRRNRVLLN